jgi:sulfur carrier protein
MASHRTPNMQILVNDEPHEIAAGTTVAALLEQLGLTGKPVAVEVNVEVVPRGRHAEHVLAGNDRLEIVTLVGGG